MKFALFAAAFAGMFFGSIAGGGAEARPGCRPGEIYRPSARVCVSKRSAVDAGIYRPRFAKASIRHRVKKNRAPRDRRVELARAHPAPPVRPDVRISPAIPDAPRLPLPPSMSMERLQQTLASYVEIFGLLEAARLEALR